MSFLISNINSIFESSKLRDERKRFNTEITEHITWTGNERKTVVKCVSEWLSNAMFYLNRMMKNKNFNFSFPYKLWLISEQSTANITNSWTFLSCSLSLVHLMLIIFDTGVIWLFPGIIIISIFSWNIFLCFSSFKIAHCHTHGGCWLLLCFHVINVAKIYGGFLFIFVRLWSQYSGLCLCVCVCVCRKDDSICAKNNNNVPYDAETVEPKEFLIIFSFVMNS